MWRGASKNIQDQLCWTHPCDDRQHHQRHALCQQNQDCRVAMWGTETVPLLTVYPGPGYSTDPSRTPLCERDSQRRQDIIIVKAQESLRFAWALLHLKEVQSGTGSRHIRAQILLRWNPVPVKWHCE
ncbi:uncharacterized protein LOC144296053 [Canis aureus]